VQAVCLEEAAQALAGVEEEVLRQGVEVPARTGEAGGQAPGVAGGEQEAAARLEHARHLRQRRVGIRQVLEDVPERHHLERARREGEAQTVRHADAARRPLAGAARRAARDLAADGAEARPRGLRQREAVCRADV